MFSCSPLFANSSCYHFKLKTKSAKESRRKTKSFFNNKQRKVNLGLQTNDYLVFIHGESSKLSIGLLRRKKAECVCLHWVKWSVVHPSVVAIWSCYLSLCLYRWYGVFFFHYLCMGRFHSSDALSMQRRCVLYLLFEDDVMRWDV